MKTFAAVLAATFVASILPVIVFCVALLALGGQEGLRILPLAFFIGAVVSFAHVFALGVPVTAWLIYRSRFTLWRMAGAGALIGLLPYAIWTQPYKYAGTSSSSSSGGAWTLIDGQPTLAGWMLYLQGAGIAAAFGVIGAAAFFLVYRSIRPNSAFQRKQLRGSAELGR